MSAEVLNPCPFCGSKTLRPFDNAVVCMICGGSGPDMGHCLGPVCRSEAIAEWNKRVVPEGWKLVPIEPTEAMWEAGREPILHYAMKSPPEMIVCRSWFDATKDNPPRADGHFPKGDAAVWTWRAMLAAAPSPPLPTGSEEKDVG